MSVAPWNMLIDKRDQDVSFIIPISVPKQYVRGGKMHIYQLSSLSNLDLLLYLVHSSGASTGVCG